MSSRAQAQSVTLHVWGPPDDGEYGFDERACHEPDQGEGRVFHTEPTSFLNRARMCLACGSIFWPKGQGQNDRGKPV